MKHIFAILVVALLFSQISAFAEDVTFVKEYSYQFVGCVPRTIVYDMICPNTADQKLLEARIFSRFHRMG